MAKTVYVELHNARFLHNRSILDLLNDIPDFEGILPDEMVISGVNARMGKADMEVWEITLLKRETTSDLYIQMLSDPTNNNQFARQTTDILTERLRTLGGTPTYGVVNRHGHLTAIDGCNTGVIGAFFMRQLKPTIH